MTKGAPLQPRQVGELIGGKYKLEAQLGEGGMGVVFAARHMGTRRRVAVKCISVNANSITANARFMREAQVAGRIEHPNVVQVLDVGEDARGRYIVMERLQGETLAQVITRRRLAPADAVDVLIPALRGVHAAHKAGIVHRDLKPENIFVCRMGDGPVRIKVLDFGVAKFVEDENDENLTRTGALLGTPQYMSPDRMLGQGQADRRNDVYAMGVILYETLSGYRPFDGPDLNEIVKKVARQNVPALSDLDPNLPPGLAAVVSKAMAPAVADRFQDIESFARALEPFAGVERFQPQVRDPTETIDEPTTISERVSLSDAAAAVVAEPPAPPRAAAVAASARPAGEGRSAIGRPARTPASFESSPPRPPRPPGAPPPRASLAPPGRPGARLAEDATLEEQPTRPPAGAAARRNDPLAVSIEAFRAGAAVQARPVRELMFQLSLGRTPRGWASAARAALSPLLDAAMRLELRDVATAIDRLDAALKRATTAASTAIDADASAALQAAYPQLSSLLPEAFPAQSQADARRARLFEAVVLRVPGMRKRLLSKLSAVGAGALEPLSRASSEDLAALAGIERELAQALVRRAQQFERERQYQDAADLQAQVERRLRALAQRLEALQIEFERAEREEAVERKRTARQGRQAALLELNQLLAELDELELAEELQRYPTSGKIQGIERYLKRAQPGAE